MNENKPKSIEGLAYAIKFDFEKYRKTELTRFKSDLASLLLEKLSLKKFSKMDLSVDSQLSQGWESDVYDGKIFTMVYKSAMEKYGMTDKDTGERVPFIQIFLSHYSKKKPQIKIDKLKENNYTIELKLKSEAIYLFLQQEAKKQGNKKLPSDFKTWKFEECVDFLKSLNMNEEDTSKSIEKLTKLFTSRYMKRIAPVDEENDDNNTETINDITNEKDNVKNYVVKRISDMLDKALISIEDKSLTKYAQYYITMKIILKYKINGFNNQIIDEYVDKDLERFYYEKYSQYEDEKYVKNIIADYTGKKPDTERKKLDKVKKLIQNSMLKNVSR